MPSLRSKVLPYPGSYGLNTQEATLTDEATRFASTVTNGVIDSTGKLTSRQDFILQTTGFSNAVESLFTWKQTDSTDVIISAARGNIYSGTTTLTLRITYSNATITSNSWQFAVLGSNIMGAQAGLNPFFVSEAYASVGFSGAAFTQPNVCIAAYGRLWAADDTSNKYTLWWSNLLDGHNWGTGDAGNINLRNAWPDGQDSVVALAPTGDRLMVFGRRSILMYTIPASHDPGSMALAATDVITDLGCIARDSVQITDDGIFFLSDNGIYKLDKLGQTTSLMTRKHVSLLCNDDILDQIAAQTNRTLIRSAFYPTEGWYVVSFPTPNVSFCVHTQKPVPNVEGAYVITRWTNTGRPFQAFTVNSARNWYSGGVNGVHLYSGYTPDGTSNNYNLVWAPQWLPFEDETRLKHGKAITLVLEAASNQTGTVTWYTDYVENASRSESFTCSAAEFGEDPGPGYVRVPLGSSFKVIRPSVSFAINGDQVTIHQAHLFATPGAMKP